MLSASVAILSWIVLATGTICAVACIAEGAFVASTGWPSVQATHAGDYLGVAAAHRRIGMRVMDHWRRDGAWLAENWVLIDLPHLMLQMGVDLLAPLQAR